MTTAKLLKFFAPPHLSSFGTDRTDIQSSCNIPFFIFFWWTPSPNLVRISYKYCPLGIFKFDVEVDIIVDTEVVDGPAPEMAESSGPK